MCNYWLLSTISNYLYPFTDGPSASPEEEIHSEGLTNEVRCFCIQPTSKQNEGIQKQPHCAHRINSSYSNEATAPTRTSGHHRSAAMQPVSCAPATNERRMLLEAIAAEMAVARGAMQRAATTMMVRKRKGGALRS